jgi:crotonobetainyl-CoA:carnitine CoA-transferase CaiB-like acyl-CoA transferase
MTQPPPLTGMVVLDLTQIMAGPFCTMLLADMGADVIKIERPGGGDDSRRLGPPFVGASGPADPSGESTAFLGLNRNKKSVVLDLKDRRGVEAVRRIAARADVLVENWRTGTMDGLGLGYEALSKLNRALIYCSISGFGHTGPYADRGGFDLIAQGMSGLMSITGQPGSAPVKVGVPIADLNAGLFAAYGILAAYAHRLKTGQGQHIETSLLEAAMAYTVYESMIYFTAGQVSGPLGSAHRLSAPYQALRTKDGYINIGAANQANWERFAKAIGRDDLLRDARFKANSDRLQNRAALEKELENTLATKTRAEWLTVLDAAGVPAGPIYDMAEVYSDPQVQARDMRAHAPHATLGQVSHIGLPVKLSETPGVIRSAAPALGQHTDEVLRWAGYSDTQVTDLRKAGVAHVSA